MYYVYLLKLRNNEIYAGSTPHLKERIEAHSRGECKAAEHYRPVKLVWYCAFTTRLHARKFEKYLKSGSGQAFRNKRLL